MNRAALPGYLDVFSKQDWQGLDQIIDDIESSASNLLETPHNGDGSEEPVDLRVMRFIVRRNQESQIINEVYTSRVLNILQQAQFLEAVRQYTRIHNLKILRMQLNLMREGSYVGKHVDQDSDPNFLITAVIRTKSNFEDGELLMYPSNRSIAQKSHSVLLMDSTVAHEVKKVSRGYRNSVIVLFGAQ